MAIVKIKQYAFENSITLKDLIIPSTINDIEQSAIYGCNSLESITLPFIGSTINGTNETYFGYIFGANSYYNNMDYVPASLKNVKILNGLSSIESHAFFRCNIEYIELPSTLTNLGTHVFYECKKLHTVQFDTNCELEIINSLTFYYCSSLKNINLPSSITDINYYAFENCHALVEIKLPESLINIGDGAFRGCSKLTDIIMSKNIESLGTNVFYNCTNLKNVYYYGQIKDWCEIEFGQDVSSPMYYRANFYLNNESSEWYIPEEIIIPNTITELNAFAFYNFTFIKRVYFEENSIVTSIGERAFYYCYNLIDLEIPETLNKIDVSVFDYVNKLENVYYGGTIESWCTISFGSAYSNPMHYAEHFYMKNEEGNWYEVTEIVIPNIITKIGVYQFYRLQNITSITIPSSVTSIGAYAFYECSSLINITIPEGVTSIGDSAFYECSSLINITIPEGVTSIGDSAFYKCHSLTRITIPSSVTSIGENAFISCKSLTDVYYTGTEEEWNAITIGSNNDWLTSATIHYNYVPLTDEE